MKIRFQTNKILLIGSMVFRQMNCRMKKNKILNWQKIALLNLISFQWQTKWAIWNIYFQLMLDEICSWAVLWVKYWGYKKCNCHMKTLSTFLMVNGQFDTPCGFSQNVSSKDRVKLKSSLKFLKSFRRWRIYLSILATFINFRRFFGFFNISFLQRN